MIHRLRWPLFAVSLLLTIGIASIPSYMGMVLPDLELETDDRGVPKEGAERVLYLSMDLYYVLFVLFCITPYVTLVFWAFSSKLGRLMERMSKKGRAGNGEAPTDERNGPKVTIVIPCYNEAAHVGSAVMNAVRQNYEGLIEVLVVDDGSTDQTYSIGRTMKMDFADRSVRVVHKINGGKASALTEGIKEATGDIIITTDGDSRLDRNAVREIVRSFKEHRDAGIVGGFVSIGNSRSNVLTRLQEFEYVITQEIVRENQSEDGSVLIAPGPIMGIRADVASVFNPIDRTVVEDCDLTQSVLSTSMTTRSNCNARSVTHAPETVSRWIAQRRRWIYGQFQAWQVNRWHIMRNPWAVFTFLTWISTAISAALLVAFTTFTIVLIFSGGGGYTLLGFMTARSIVVLVLYYATRAAILMVHSSTRSNIHYLPIMPIYDLALSFLSVYLFGRYMLGAGATIRWGGRRVVVH